MSIHSASASTSDSTCPNATQLVRALQRHAGKVPKPLVHGSAYCVPLDSDSDAESESDADVFADGSPKDADSDTEGGISSRKLSRKGKERILTSWKVSEFAYRKVQRVGTSEEADLPTLARGLFTTQTRSAEGVGEEEHRIVVRGYDKFFNVDEMQWTKHASLEKYTTAPYLLTFKENGCIIFISALTSCQLVVCSKHSLGDRAEVQLSHAKAGEAWVDRHLQQVGKSRKDLAKELWEHGWTAVAELCDDSFEEHVLAYSPNRTGLHLHGLNHNTVHFQTERMERVHEFAKTWGFIPPRWKTFDSLEGLLHFTEIVGETGTWEGEAIEGFVVRTSMPAATAKSSSTSLESHTDRPRDGAAQHLSTKFMPPYEAGQAWFFKIKFEEPYLMYREWRELTRMMITAQRKWADKHKSDLETALRGNDSEAACFVRKEAAGSEDAEHAQDLETQQKVQELRDALHMARTQADVTLSKKARKKSQKELEQRLAKLDPTFNVRRDNAPSGVALRDPKTLWKHLPHVPPDRPKVRSGRKETKLYIEWVEQRLYGSPDGKIAPDTDIFEGYAESRGIISSRNIFLQYMDSEEGQRRLKDLQPAVEANGGKRRGEGGAEKERAFSHTILVPIAVPGCGKTILSIALVDLISQSVQSSVVAPASSSTPSHLPVSHIQADDMMTKKTGPAFLRAITAELDKGSKVIVADRNNHLIKHRRELVQEIEKWERDEKAERLAKTKGLAEQQNRKEKQKERQVNEGQGHATDVQAVSGVDDGATDTATPSRTEADMVVAPRVRLIALPWDLTNLPLNAIHRICSDRIVQRGDNHQSLRVDRQGALGSTEHEDIIWKFLHTWQPFGARGDTFGDGHVLEEEDLEGDSAFDGRIDLDVDAKEEENVSKAFDSLSHILDLKLKGVQAGQEAQKARRISEALERAKLYKVTVDRVGRKQASEATTRAESPSKAPRYYGITVELDSYSILKGCLSSHASTSPLHAEALDMLESLHRGSRIVKRPHITLVHSSELAVDEATEPSARTRAAQRKWERYKQVCRDAATAMTGMSDGNHASAQFDIVLDRIAWQPGRAMTFGVSKTEPLSCASVPDFEALQCGADASAECAPEQGEEQTYVDKDWTPHVTIGTAKESIRPYEANAVLQEADATAAGTNSKVKLLHLGERRIRLQGRLQGMNW